MLRAGGQHTGAGGLQETRRAPAQGIPKVDALCQLAAHHAQHDGARLLAPAAAALAAAAACRPRLPLAAALNAVCVLLQAGLNLSSQPRLPEHALALRQLAQQAALLPPARAGGAQCGGLSLGAWSAQQTHRRAPVHSTAVQKQLFLQVPAAPCVAAKLACKHVPGVDLIGI